MKIEGTVLSKIFPWMPKYMRGKTSRLPPKPIQIGTCVLLVSVPGNCFPHTSFDQVLRKNEQSRPARISTDEASRGCSMAKEFSGSRPVLMELGKNLPNSSCVPLRSMPKVVDNHQQKHQWPKANSLQTKLKIHASTMREIPPFPHVALLEIFPDPYG